MPRKTKDGQPFNQAKYMYEWSKENMLSVAAKYNREFVLEFRDALKKLNLKQSDVIRNAMQDVIDEANKVSTL